MAVNQSGRPVPFTSLVVWASFFGTVLFLVNENMVPLVYLALNGPVLTPISTPPTEPLTPTRLAVGTLPSLQQFPQIRDPEWLKLEICREFQRGACKRTAEECRYAHPGKKIQIASDGKVIACYDALKGKCTRESCKYLHPTNILKQQLEINGKQTLMQNRAMLQQMVPIQPATVHGSAALSQGGLVGYEQVAAGNAQPLAGLPASQFYSPTVAAAAPAPAAAYSVLQTSDLAALSPQLLPYYQIATPTPMAAMLPATGSLRADKLEVCRDFQRGNCTRGETECRYAHPPDRSMIDATDNTVTVCMDCIKGRCTREKCKYFHPPSHLQAKIRAAQNPGATVLPPLSPAAIASPQPTVMMNNGSSLGQPPLKRHAFDGSMITSGGGGVSTSGLTSSSVSSQPAAALTAIYGYSGAAIPSLTTMHHQSLPAAPTYYQQTIPMLHLQYGAATNALAAAAAAAPAPTTPLTTFNIPTTSSGTPNGNVTPYALLNGHSQLAGDSKPIHHVTSTPGSLTVCRDFQSGKCSRPFCRFVHVREDYVEVRDDKVTICQNALEGKCVRPHCKFYHLPSAQEATPQSTNVADLSYGEVPTVGAVANLASPGLIPLIANGALPTLPQAYPAAVVESNGV